MPQEIKDASSVEPFKRNIKQVSDLSDSHTSCKNVVNVMYIV